MKIETKKDLWALASVLIFAGFVVVGMIASTFSDGYFLLAVVEMCPG